MNADSEAALEDLVARALTHCQEHELDMTAQDIQESYQRLVQAEAWIERELDKNREELRTAREDDVRATAEAVLTGNDWPKRKQVKLARWLPRDTDAAGAAGVVDT